MQSLMGVFAVVALLGALVVLIGCTIGPAVLRRAANALLDHRLLLTAGIGVVATLGSLYFSEMGLKYVPCRWCWYQRTMMYPIAVVGLVAWIRRDHNSRPYFVALSSIGAVMSCWHMLIEFVPERFESPTCSLFGPACSDVYFRSFGIFSLANMALIGFLSVLVLNVFHRPDRSRSSSEVGASTS